MVKGMWYNPAGRVFGCDGHSKCYVKCLNGKGSANMHNPNCGAFNPPAWAKKFVCPRFIYEKQPDGSWLCVHDELGLIVPLREPRSRKKRGAER